MALHYGFLPHVFPATLISCDTEQVTALEIVRHGTALRPVPLVPRIRLYLADKPVGLWENIEAASGQNGIDPPFWAFAWAGGQALARYLLDHPEVVRGRRVIDIASGSGLVAIAAALAGASAVTGYDIDPLAIAAIELNASANGVDVRAERADILDQDADTDLILVADAFYERRLAERVTRFLARAHSNGVDVLIGDLGRTYLPRNSLTPLAAYDVSGLGTVEDCDTKRTTVWTHVSDAG
jgi:predicted nicotinamide N-methyase